MTLRVRKSFLLTPLVSNAHYNWLAEKDSGGFHSPSTSGMPTRAQRLTHASRGRAIFSWITLLQSYLSGDEGASWTSCSTPKCWSEPELVSCPPLLCVCSLPEPIHSFHGLNAINMPISPASTFPSSWYTNCLPCIEVGCVICSSKLPHPK